MKKTLIALVALAGMAMGATTSNIDTTDTALKAYINFETTGLLAGGSMSDANWSNTPTITNGYGQITGTSTTLYTTVAGLSARTGYSISFDINNASTGSLLTLGTQNGQNQAWRACKISLDESKVLTAAFLGNTTNALTHTLDVTSDDWTTLTLVVSEGNTTNTLTLTFYVDGDLVGSYDTANASNFVSETTNKVAFGYFANNAVGNGGATTNIDNILVYSKALTAGEVKALITPEPATATLSLLALAGLAARRKRH